MRKLRPAQPNEQGAVALITTIIMSILLTIITTGLIGVMIGELRQATDAENSTKAYYAAQSGVEDALAKVTLDVKNNALTDHGCSTNTNLLTGSPGVLGWTCQQISYSLPPAGNLDHPDEARQINIGSTSFRSLKLSWDTAPNMLLTYYNPLGQDGFPNTTSGYNLSPILELAIIDYPQGTFSNPASAIKLRNYVIVPTTGSGVTPNYNDAPVSNAVFKAKCIPTGFNVPHCTAIINFGGANGKGFILRLRSRYRVSDYAMEFHAGLDGNGAVVQVADDYATIDVTAKSGDSYRRLVYAVPLKKGISPGLDYAIYSDTGVCKDLSVLGVSTSNGSFCP